MTADDYVGFTIALQSSQNEYIQVPQGGSVGYNVRIGEATSEKVGTVFTLVKNNDGTGTYSFQEQQTGYGGYLSGFDAGQDGSIL